MLAQVLGESNEIMDGCEMVFKTESIAQVEGISSVFITVVFFKTDLPLTTAPHAPTLKS